MCIALELSSCHISIIWKLRMKLHLLTIRSQDDVMDVIYTKMIQLDIIYVMRRNGIDRDDAIRYHLCYDM